MRLPSPAGPLLLILTLLFLPLTLLSTTADSRPLTAAQATTTPTDDGGLPTATITPTLTITATVTLTATSDTTPTATPDTPTPDTTLTPTPDTPTPDTPTPDTTLTPTPDTTLTPTPDTTGTPEYLLHLPLIDRARETVRYEWVSVTSPTTNTLNSISMVSATDGWAVGANGTIIHWDGRAWSNVPSPTTQNLNSVSMTSASNGWAVGDGGAMLRWDGSVWSLYPSEQIWNALEAQPLLYPFFGNYIPHIRAVTMLSPTEGWAGGGNIRSSGRFDPSGYTTLLRWDGASWTPTVYRCNEGVGVCMLISSMAFASPTEGWAVANNTGGTLHWDGQTWTLVGGLGLMYSVDVLSPTDAWATGSHDLVQHWDGSTWSRVSVNGGTAVEIVSQNDVWLVDRVFQHWNGTIWTIIPGPEDKLFYAMEMSSSLDGWAVGLGYSEGAVIARYVPRRVPWP